MRTKNKGRDIGARIDFGTTARIATGTGRSSFAHLLAGPGATGFHRSQLLVAVVAGVG